MRYALKRVNLQDPTVLETSYLLILHAFAPNRVDDMRTPMEFRQEQLPLMFRECFSFGLFQHNIQIGFGVLKPHENNVFELMFLCVHPQNRGSAAGMFLLRGLIREAIRLRAAQIRIDVMDDAPSLKRWFRSVGFREQKTIVCGANLSLCRMTLTPNEAYADYLALCTVADRLPNLRYAFCAMKQLPYASVYPTMLVVLQPYSTMRRLSEQEYHQMLLRDEDRLQASLRNITEYLDGRGIPWISVSEKNDFSMSRAAVLAGLGWIGKNDRLTTASYGQKLLIAGLLIGKAFPDNRIIRQSNCGDCRNCVDVCPVSCLKNKVWVAGMSEQELMDTQACASYRNLKRTKLGRPDECALCMWACNGNVKKRSAPL